MRRIRLTKRGAGGGGMVDDDDDEQPSTRMRSGGEWIHSEPQQQPEEAKMSKVQHQPPSIINKRFERSGQTRSPARSNMPVSETLPPSMESYTKLSKDNHAAKLRAFKEKATIEFCSALLPPPLDPSPKMTTLRLSNAPSIESQASMFFHDDDDDNNNKKKKNPSDSRFPALDGLRRIFSVPGAYRVRSNNDEEQQGEFEDEEDEEEDIDSVTPEQVTESRTRETEPMLLNATRVYHDDQSTTSRSNIRIPSAEVVQPKALLRRKWFWAIVCLVLTAVGVSTALGVTLGFSQEGVLTLSPTGAPTNEIITAPPTNSPTQEDRCSLCSGGTNETTFSIAQLNQTMIPVLGTSMNCLALMESQPLIPISDIDCERGQALSWKHCGCPSVLSRMVGSSACSLCLRGSQPKNQSDYCINQNEFVSIVGSWMPEMCESLVNESSLVCNCPTESDLRKSDFQRIVSSVVVNTSVFLDEASPQSKALEWLVFEDPLALNVSDPGLNVTIQERFIILVVYFSTGGQNWTRQDLGFLSGTSVCSWGVGNPAELSFMGVSCLIGSEIFVSQLSLSNNNLVGTIPAEIEFLTSLRSLLLGENELTGTIPSSLSRLNWLSSLVMNRNRLTGTIPEEIFLMSSLLLLSLNSNELSGSIPDSLETRRDLISLDLGLNFLTGTIPNITEHLSLQALVLHFNLLDGTIPELVAVSNARIVFLGTNALTGTIPQSISQLPPLSIFDVSGNLLTGTLPRFNLQFGSLTWFGANNNELTGQISTVFDTVPRSLTTLRLNGNILDGSIPSSIGTFRLLVTCWVHDNFITGTIPSEIGLLALTDLGLGDNTMTGTIPTEIGLLGGLGTLYLGQNLFTGTLPTELGSVGEALSTLILSGNFLSGVLPDELEALINLKALDISFNQFSAYPSVLERMSSLIGVAMAGNNFENVTAICTNSPFQTKSFYALAVLACDDEVICSCCNYCCETDSCSSVLSVILTIASGAQSEDILLLWTSVLRRQETLGRLE